jgi:hypothetical protein
VSHCFALLRVQAFEKIHEKGNSLYVSTRGPLVRILMEMAALRERSDRDKEEI